MNATACNLTYNCATCGQETAQEIPAELATPRLIERTRLILSRTRARCKGCEEAERSQKGQEVQEARLQDAIRTAGIPLKLATHWDRSRGNLELMRWVWNHRSKGIFLAAQQRKNKTWCLAAVLAEMVKTGEVRAQDVSWWRMVDLEDRLSRLYQERDHTAAAFLNRLGTVPILMIDDVDKGNFTKAVSQKFYAIIDQRTLLVPHGRLWLTSNNGGRALVAKMVDDPKNQDCSFQRAVAIVTRLDELCDSPPRSVFDWTPTQTEE